MRPGPSRAGVGERSTTACSYFLHCARAGQKMCFGSSREWGKQAQQPIFAPFFSLRTRRAESCALVPALFFWFQPEGGERNTAACSHFFHCARAGQKNALWFQPTAPQHDEAPAAFCHPCGLHWGPAGIHRGARPPHCKSSRPKRRCNIEKSAAHRLERPAPCDGSRPERRRNSKK